MNIFSRHCTNVFSVIIGLFHATAFAAVIEVTSSDDLQLKLDLAKNGDVVLLADGRYQGNFIVTNSIAIEAKFGEQAKVILDAGGKGNNLTLLASNSTIKHLKFINWGDDLTEQNSAIYGEKNLTNLVISDNQFEGDGFGIWIQKTKQVMITNNVIKGNPSLRSADRGNGIQLSNVQNVEVIGNEVSYTRDGLYIIGSQQNVLRGNTMHHLRYGVHYMYSHSNKVIDNLAYQTRAGYALMSSKQLTVEGNVSRDSEDYGMLMNFITSSTISNNIINNVWTKPENKVLGREGKGLFVYNSAYNTISYNLIDTAEIGIHLTAGSENTKVYGNNFINNPVQVKYVSNREQEWSQDGVGNYWSNYLGWDLNNDGAGDTPFEPNDGIDKLVWEYPEAKVLLDSPSVLVLRWVQKQFPILKPAGVKDSYPQMSPVTAPSLANN
ncbi:nitrous oxide reductase family maturation protein NosD [Aliivibrio kagoshimensis]|uniref:nitrous oxide reductase family maturation protein NosD n=1 Tax=Aliivibrio kagoshimensis TaxID=2910230 RepID=UPI003D0F133C